MYCKFCHELSNFRLCSRCANYLKTYRNALEDPNMNVSMSKKCKFVVEQIKRNEMFGGYIPPYSAASREETECQQCGRKYHRVSPKSTGCPDCKKMADKFRMLKGQKATHRTSERMMSYYMTYCRRQLVEGREVPRVFLSYIASIESPYFEYEKYKKTKP